MKDIHKDTDQACIAGTGRDGSKIIGKIQKPSRKTVDTPMIRINDRKKANYDLYTIGKKPQV